MGEQCVNATYEHRIDDPESWNFCPVPGGGEDVFLFLAVAVAIGSFLHFSRLSAVLVLLAGAVSEILVYWHNLGRAGNAFTLWLVRDRERHLETVCMVISLSSFSMSLQWDFSV